MEKKRNWFKTLQARSSISLLIVAAVMIQISGAVQFYFARDGIRKEVDERARMEMSMRSLEIQQMVTNVEAAVDNVDLMLSWVVDNPQNIYPMLEEFVMNNPGIRGCALAFEPNYYPDKGKLFEPYVLRDTAGHIVRMQIANDAHNYLEMDWYRQGKASDTGCWTEPYIDNDGAHSMVCTYAFPIHNTKGEQVAVFGVDLSLDWLSDAFASEPEQHTYSFIVSRTGRFLACTEKDKIMQYTLADATRHFNDTAIKRVNNDMLAGLSGSAEARDNNGELGYIYYAPVGSGTGWSIAIIYSDREIYRNLRDIALKLGILMIIGLALMVYIMWRTVRGFRKLQNVNAEKERIGSELRIASKIQNGMLPKTFPPYDDLDELSLYGSLVSAREVGGDLYDFYPRDNMFFFCIGDVSGKGVPASLVMAVTRSLFRTVSARVDDPGQILTQINNAMSDMNETSMFVTLFIGAIDLHNGQLYYSNAGHCAPILVGDEPQAIEMDSNIPVGVMSGWQFTTQQVQLKPEQTLFLYTDGLNEAENADHDQYGDDRILKVLKACNKTPRALVESITQDVQQFVNGAEQSDDLTLLALQLTKLRETNETHSSRSIILHNDVQEVDQLTAFVEGLAEEHNLDPSLTLSLNLAIEETVVNIMKYAYPEGTVGKIELRADINGDNISFTVRDSGTPFDPTQSPDPDITLDAEHRAIGGLGIMLTRNIMDTIEYHHDDGSNILTLNKKIKAQ